MPTRCLRSFWVGTVSKSDIHHPQRWDYVAAEEVGSRGLGWHLCIQQLRHTELGEGPQLSLRLQPKGEQRGTGLSISQAPTWPWKALVSHSSACRMVYSDPLCWAKFSALNTGRLPATVYFMTLLTRLGALPIHRGNEDLIV